MYLYIYVYIYLHTSFIGAYVSHGCPTCDIFLVCLAILSLHDFVFLSLLDLYVFSLCQFQPWHSLALFFRFPNNLYYLCLPCRLYSSVNHSLSSSLFLSLPLFLLSLFFALPLLQLLVSDPPPSLSFSLFFLSILSLVSHLYFPVISAFLRRFSPASATHPSILLLSALVRPSPGVNSLDFALASTLSCISLRLYFAVPARIMAGMGGPPGMGYGGMQMGGGPPHGLFTLSQTPHVPCMCGALYDCAQTAFR